MWYKEVRVFLGFVNLSEMGETMVLFIRMFQGLQLLIWF